MSASRFIVSLDRSPHRTDCFASLPRVFVERTLAQVYFGNVPQMVPLQLKLARPAEHPDGAGSADVAPRTIFVGALSSSAHGKAGTITLGAIFASTIGLSEGDTVTVRPLVDVPAATAVVVEPASVDDSEVIEGNQGTIEASLLRQLRVVHSGARFPVPVSAGVRATLIVREIRVATATGSPGLGQPSVAVLAEGTELHVATKARCNPAATDAEGDGSHRPREALVRCEAGSLGAADGHPLDARMLRVRKDVAAQRHWLNGTELGVLPLHVIIDHWSEVKSAALSANAASAVKEPERCSTRMASLLRKAVRVVVVIEESLELAPETVAHRAVRAVSSATPEMPVNMYAFPSPPECVRFVENPAASAPAAASAKRLGLVNPALIPSLSQLAEVHGADLLRTLPALVRSLTFTCPDAAPGTSHVTPDATPISHNLLICGCGGSGKSTIAIRSALVSGLYVEVVESGRARSAVLTDLRAALLRCLANGPGVVVLNDIDVLAPADNEGPGTALPLHFIVSLSWLLREVAAGVAVNPLPVLPDCCVAPLRRNRVVVVATCKSREHVHEALRTTACFAHIVKVAALSPAARGTLLAQLAPEVKLASLQRLGSSMDNYTPFDVCQLVRRCRAGSQQLDADKIQAAIATFAPLAHAGVKFLKPASQTWDDVGGMAEPRKVLENAILLPVKYPSIFDALPLKTRSGVLLYGPPGCGKTYLMSVLVAAEKVHCIVVNGPEVLDKYIGASEQKVRDVFERAQAVAPCVIFFDEFDSIAPQRGHDNTGVTDRVVNQLLCYLDGVEGRKNVFVVAASSRPDLIDAALLRPGRLDKAVYCALPSEEERKAVLIAHSRRMRLDPAGVDFGRLARITERWTCADLAGLATTTNMTVMQRTIDMKKHLAGLNTGNDSYGSADASHASAKLPFVVEAHSREQQAAALRTLSDSALASVLLSRADDSDAAGAGPGVESQAGATLPVITTEDFVEAMGRTRPSISAKDAARYEAMYQRFAQARSAGEKGRGSDGNVGTIPDSRTTMA